MYVRVFSAVLLLACVGLAFKAWGYEPPFSYDPVGPRAYPLLLLGLLAVGSLYLLAKPASGPTEPINWPLAKRIGLCILAMLAYAFLFEPLGFVLSTALAGFVLGMVFNGRVVPSLISGVLMGVLFYVLFDYLLDVPLPLGVLEILEG